jgi:histidyl-tRNA synthetase
MDSGNDINSNIKSPRDKLKDSEFINLLKEKLRALNETPGLKEKLLEINNIKDEEKRKEALNELPGVREKMKEIMDMLGISEK